MRVMDTQAIGRLILLLGAALLVLGLLLSAGARIPWLGRLPGDFSFGGSGWRVFVPLGTSLVLSLLLTLLLWIFTRRR